MRLILCLLLTATIATAQPSPKKKQTAKSGPDVQARLDLLEKAVNDQAMHLADRLGYDHASIAHALQVNPDATLTRLMAEAEMQWQDENKKLSDQLAKSQMDVSTLSVRLADEHDRLNRLINLSPLMGPEPTHCLTQNLGGGDSTTDCF